MSKLCVFSGFSWGYVIIPNRLINLKGKTTVKHLQLNTFLLSRNSCGNNYILQACFTWDANTPPSGEPDTARLPTYQGEVIITCLTDPTLCRPEENIQKYRRLCTIDRQRKQLHNLTLFPFDSAMPDYLLVPAPMPLLPFFCVMAVVLGMTLLRAIGPLTCRRRR